MSVLNVALIGSEEFARNLGKRGDARDIETFIHKEEREGNQRILSFLRPMKHPESLRPLLSVLDVARAGVVEVKRIDSALGEVMVALGCAGIDRGHVIISPEEGDWVDPAEIEMILKQAGIGDWEVHENGLDEHEIRGSLFEIQDFLEDGLSDQSEGPLVLPVDQHFNVKGVGLVAIGYVQSGKVSKHEEIEILPTGESGVVRSLQVMDDDVDTALSGDRVGVALRNAREQALHRGCMICSSGSKALVRVDSSRFDFQRAPFQKRLLAEGDVVHASTDMQFVVGRVVEVSGDEVSVIWDSGLWIRTQGSNIIISQLDAPMRIMGFARILPATIA